MMKASPSAVSRRPAMEYTGLAVAKRTAPLRAQTPAVRAKRRRCAVPTARSSATHSVPGASKVKPQGEGARSWSSERPGSSSPAGSA